MLYRHPPRRWWHLKGRFEIGIVSDDLRGRQDSHTRAVIIEGQEGPANKLGK
jgi:hypothetical protein